MDAQLCTDAHLFVRHGISDTQRRRWMAGQGLRPVTRGPQSDDVCVTQMGRQIAELRDVPRVKLPVGAPSQFRLRHEHREDGMSTFEAIARSLGIIEGSNVQQELEAIFKIRVERTLWSRGKLAPEHCAGGVPAAAYLAHYIAGCAGSAKLRSPRTEI